MKVLSQRQSVWNRDDFAAIAARLILKSEEDQKLMVGATAIEPVTLPCQGNRTSIKSNRYGEKDALNDRISQLINKENFVFALELLWNRVPHRDEVGIE